MGRAAEGGRGQIALGPQAPRVLLTPNTSKSGGLIKETSITFLKLISRP